MLWALCIFWTDSKWSVNCWNEGKKKKKWNSTIKSFFFFFSLYLLDAFVYTFSFIFSCVAFCRKHFSHTISVWFIRNETSKIWCSALMNLLPPCVINLNSSDAERNMYFSFFHRSLLRTPFIQITIFNSSILLWMRNETFIAFS